MLIRLVLTSIQVQRQQLASSGRKEEDQAKEGEVIKKLLDILRRRLISDLPLRMHSYYKDKVFLGELEVYVRTK